MAALLRATDSFVSSVANGSPPVQAITLDYAKSHIRALGTTDDSLISVYINAASSYFEEQTGRQLLTANRELWLDGFPFQGASGVDARIELPRPPLQAVTSISYIDSSGAAASLAGGSPASFLVTTPKGEYGRRGTVEPLFGSSWPTAQYRSGAVKIRYSCGYADGPNTMPELVRQILAALVGHYDTYRTDVHDGRFMELPFGVRENIAAFKYSAYPTQELTRYATPLDTTAATGWPLR